jgi:outer membrane protein assembly factor BamD
MISFRWVVVAAAIALALTGCFRRKKYENPITKDTAQPDKALYDKAINDIEKGRYEVARLVLQNLINTYDTSEFLAKAKLAIADAWMREGGSHGLAQAEAEYKDFILFYPTLEEAAEAQEKICMLHVRQMEKPDRDLSHALRAEDECRTVLTQFPNSKFAPRVQQLLRNIQEQIAESHYRVGAFYHQRQSWPSAASRLSDVTGHYPLFSKADYALWLQGDAYSRMGPRFREQTIGSYQKIVRDYPLSAWADEARKKLASLEAPIPEPDPVAEARMKYELANKEKIGMMSHFWGIFRKSPDMRSAAKSGAPAMTALRPSIPASVPTPEEIAKAEQLRNEVSISSGGDTSALDTQPDARLTPPGAPQTAPVKPEDKKKNQKEKKPATRK